MKELIVSIVKIGLMVSVVVSMFAQGLSISPGRLVIFRERPLLLLRSLLVVIFLVPVAALLIIFLLKPSPAVTVGLAILAASPAAPLMLVKVPKSGGSLAYMASLHLTLALLALVTVPITLDLFSKALDFRAQVDVAAVAKVVGITILLPVCLGVVIRSRFTNSADTMSSLLARFGEVVLLILALFILAMNFGFLLRMDPWSYLAMVLVVAISLAIGHVLGPRDHGERTTLAMESASRHPGLAMAIAALNFSPQKALPVLVPYMLVFIVVTTIYLQWRKRSNHKSVGQSPAVADADITLSKGGKT